VALQADREGAHRQAYTRNKKRILATKDTCGICGAPASGKITYVLQHKGKWDICIDLDYLRQALMLGGSPMPDTLSWAIVMRDAIYQAIAEIRYYYDTIWVIAGLPKRAERQIRRIHIARGQPAGGLFLFA